MNMKNLAAIRHYRGLSQRQLAKAANIRHSYVALLEAGRTGGVPVAFALADALGVAVEDLYRGDYRCPECGIPSANVIYPEADLCPSCAPEPAEPAA